MGSQPHRVMDASCRNQWVFPDPPLNQSLPFLAAKEKARIPRKERGFSSPQNPCKPCKREQKRTLVAHDCGYPLSRYTCCATRVAADFLDFIAFCRCSTRVALHLLKILVSHLPPCGGTCRTKIWVWRGVALHGGVAATDAGVALHCATKKRTKKQSEQDEKRGKQIKQGLEGQGWEGTTQVGTAGPEPGLPGSSRILLDFDGFCGCEPDFVRTWRFRAVPISFVPSPDLST